MSPSAADIITTIAGSGGTGAFSGDSGQATSAELNLPSEVALDASGNSRYSRDNNNNIITLFCRQRVHR